jgi:regulator of RNase E activity RraA
LARNRDGIVDGCVQRDVGDRRIWGLRRRGEMTDKLTQALVKALIAVDTPTICNAIEIVEGRRASGGFTRQPVVAAFPALPPILGFARTATIAAAAPSNIPAQEQKALKVAYYRQFEATEPVIAVIEDTDDQPGIGAMWGEVNSAIHKGLGVQGALTNGSIRDLDMLAPGFQLLAGMLGPSHAHVHVAAVGVPVTVFGLRIHPGDLIHADKHGAVIIPPGMAKALPAAIELCNRQEAPILRAARAPGFSVDKLLAAWGEADDIH